MVCWEVGRSRNACVCVCDGDTDIGGGGCPSATFGKRCGPSNDQGAACDCSVVDVVGVVMWWELVPACVYMHAAMLQYGMAHYLFTLGLQSLGGQGKV